MTLYRNIALSLAVSLAWPVPPATAAPPKRPSKNIKKRGEQHRDPSEPDPAIIEQARTLSDEAFLRFDTRDYAGAVSLWREAEQLLPIDPIYGDHRRHFTIQIAYAYKESYEFGGEPDELAAAREQFEIYLASLPPDDKANRQLITREIEDIDALAQAAEREAIARRQEAYDDYLANFARAHGGYGIYRNKFAIGREPVPDEVLDGFELLEHMGQPGKAPKHRRLRRMSLAGWGLSAVGFFIVLLGLPLALQLHNEALAGVSGGGGVLAATGLGIGIGGTMGLQRLDIDGAMDDHNTRLARDRGLIELRPISALPRIRRFERATGFRVGINVQGLQL